MEPLPPPAATDPRRDVAALIARLGGSGIDLARTLLEENPNLFAVADAAGRIVYANAALERFHGALPPSTFSIFDDRFLREAGHAERARRVLLGETVRIPAVRIELSRVDPAFPAGTHHVGGLLFPLPGAGGKVEHFVLVQVDETDRAEAERRLRESLETARVILNSVQGPFVLVDRAGILLDCNDALAGRYGMRRHELVGRNMYDMMPPAVAEFRRGVAARVFATGRDEHFREEGMHGGVFLTDVYPVRDDAGAVVRLVIHSRDVTAEMRRQDALAEARQYELVGRLAGGAAHDFNNLLSGVRGHLSLLSRDLPPAARERMRRIDGLVERGATLVRHLLGFARGGANERGPVDLVLLARDHLPLFSCTHRGILVEFVHDEPSVMIHADSVRIEQILLNLLINAAEAMRDFGTVIVSVGIERLDADDAERLGLAPGRYAALVVADEGPGIAPSDLRRVFEPFFSTKAENPVRGMGLASALDIARAHGGVIEATSAPGSGGTFRVLLPLAPDAASAPNAAPAPPLLPGRGRILVVDDEEGVRETTTELLAGLGYDTETAASGEAAVERIAAEGPPVDLVILDLVMPGMGGRAAFARLRASRPGLPVLFLTGSGEEAAAGEGAGFVRKPFTFEVLAAAVAEALGRGR